MRRIIWWIIAALIAHVISSYVCLFFILQRADSLDIELGSHVLHSKVTLSSQHKYFAPIHLFRILSDWPHVDVPAKVAFLWGCYLVPFCALFIMFLLVPRFLFIDDDFAPERRRRRR